ncbi:dTDP-L-rhamnose 4-epimerase [Anaerobacterium chartisolvens]|uniref:dTDP-L-rhamnose 4-epimerase n=1 Tax=Anaerobacterium chartisolvens TaxID=1297424 RepID=A0A369AT46_9FIRM|nr:NAD-dependent epimerase/dehydratase family protein [Anaerobacterium chartisolvens]RCX12542.1 dTDP-L-rhamnose 4-epimerase [Anaerobacterium chartisolvens]
MRALVTGGAGFIGSHIVDSLLLKGYEVRILDVLAGPVHRGGRKPAYLSGEAELIIGDVRDKDAVLRAIDGVDVIFHEAAEQGYMQNYSKFFHVNSVGTALLFEAIAEKRQDVRKIVIASSQAVYGEGRYFCAEHGNFSPMPREIQHLEQGRWEHVCPVCGRAMGSIKAEEAFINPNTQYAVSKYTQEMIGFNLGRRHNIPVVCLRYSIVLGKRQSFYNMYTGILRSFAVQLMLGQAPVIFEDGRMQRDYIHVDDVAEANMCVLESAGADFKAFNVGSGISTDVLSFYSEVAGCMGSGLKPVMNGEFRVGDVRHIVSSPSGLQRLGWSFSRSVHDMVSDYIEYLNKAERVDDCFALAMKEMKEKTIIMKSMQ